ncbi:hypothetical protein Esti_005284 [Eimeria stiedai]
MAGLKFLVLAAASLLFVEDVGAVGNEATESTTTGTVTPSMGVPNPAEAVNHTGERVDCLDAMNAARKELGLPDLKKKDEVPALGDKLNGTYMYTSQDSPDKNCAAAVEKWRGTVTNFPSAPPAYTTQEPFYQKPENISLLGLFNPTPNSTVDCAIITCQSKAPKGQSGGISSQVSRIRPSQDLWDRIRVGKNSSTQPPLFVSTQPPLFVALALAAAAFVHAFF